MNNKQIELSAVVLAKDEEARIAACLESLKFCDEIIVVDNASKDKTVAIARKYTPFIIQTDSSDFSILRNIGKDKAKGMWLLYIDADEMVPEKLRREITSLVKSTSESTHLPVGYFITRENYYLGKKWPIRDKMQRLFLKSACITWKGKLHETAIVEGPMATLREPLIHNTHRTLEEMVEKTNIWSAYEAELRLRDNHPKIVWWRLLRVMGSGFYRSFFMEGGWKAGTVGWIESIYQGFSMFITYAKLWELQEKKRKSI